MNFSLHFVDEQAPFTNCLLTEFNHNYPMFVKETSIMALDFLKITNVNLKQVFSSRQSDLIIA